MKNETKAVKAIRTIVLNQKAIDVLIDTFTKQAVILGSATLDAKLKEKLHTFFTSAEFLNPFADYFKTLFKDEEISQLIEIYEIDVLKKWLENMESVVSPLYKAMQSQVEKIAQSG